MTHRKAVGIDLGTTFSAVAHIDAYGKPQIIPNTESERITPSVILFDGTCAFCEGSVHDAEGLLVAHATGTFKYLKGLPAGGKRIQRLHASD